MNTRSVSLWAGRRSGRKLLVGLALLLQGCYAGGPSRILVLSADRGCKVVPYTLDGKEAGGNIWIGGYGCTGIATDAAGNVLVTIRAPQGGGVWKFTPDGQRSLVIPSSGASALALDSNENVHVLIAQNMENWLVRTFRPDGTALGEPIRIRLSNMTGIALDRSGNLLALSKDDEVVKSFSPDGQPGPLTIKTGEIPNAIAVSPDGKIYVANNWTITTYSPDGKRIHQPISWQIPGSGLDTPVALTVDNGGILYAGFYNGWVGSINSQGTPLGPAFKSVREVRGIAVH
jgi:sugar lactone lactonase YvrE